MQAAYIVDLVRTPIGKLGGALSSVRPDDLAAHVIKELFVRNPALDPSLIDDVVMGAANQAGEDNRNVARMALLLAGLPVTVPGVTVNRLCASGLQAIMDASRAIRSGDGNVYIAGGAESMTRAPFVMAKAETPFAREPQVFDTTMGWRFINKKLTQLHHPYSMGETAENVARQWQITRDQQDAFACQSQQKYQAAAARGAFNAELVPVTVPHKNREATVFAADEHPRVTSLDQLANLKPVFLPEGGTVTAGNSSGLNDGAAACLVVSEAKLNQLNLKPLARVVAAAVAGVAPDVMGIGPVPATQKALQLAGLTINDMDLIELNEAFAAQALACMQDLNLDPAKVNVNGGAIALGHPLGASGTRISATLIHEMQKRSGIRWGLATMCVGVGQGAAVIYEKC